eukprot:gene13098-16703_t
MPRNIAFSTFVSVGCAECRNLEGTRTTFAYEALVRGVNGESAASILDQVNDDNRYRFDQACRVKAIERATELGLL